jgi:hypothetical protein
MAAMLRVYKCPSLMAEQLEAACSPFRSAHRTVGIAYFSITIYGDAIDGEEKIRGNEKNAKFQEKDGLTQASENLFDSRAGCWSSPVKINSKDYFDWRLP